MNCVLNDLKVSSSSMSSSNRSRQPTLNTSTKRVRSNSPPSQQNALLVTKDDLNNQQQLEVEEEPVNRINVDNEEPIRLSKFSGGYEPDPQTPRKIETVDWPGPPYPAAVPELRARSRSSSNRRAHSTVHSVNGERLDGDDDSDEDEEDHAVNLEVTGVHVVLFIRTKMIIRAIK